VTNNEGVRVRVKVNPNIYRTSIALAWWTRARVDPEPEDT